METQMKIYFINGKELNFGTIAEYDNNQCWLLEKGFEKTKRCRKCEKTGVPHLICNDNRIVEQHCHSTGKFRGLAYNKSHLYTRKNCASFVPKILTIFSEKIVV